MASLGQDLCVYDILIVEGRKLSEIRTIKNKGIARAWE